MEEVKKRDLIIFDLDGTLVDSSEDIAWVANRTLEVMGRTTMIEAAIKERIGWGVGMLLRQIMPGESPERLREAKGIFLDLYAGHLVVKSALYPGVAETVDRLSRAGKTLAILTNKPHALSVEIVKRLFGDAIFAELVGGDSLTKRKPDPEPVKYIMDSLGAGVSDSVIVGDSPVDVEAGKGAGIYTIGAAYGFRGVVELEEAGADVIIERFPELVDILI